MAARPFYAQLLTGDGHYRTINLRPGTVINPTGMRLRVGMHVAAIGIVRDDGSMSADTIDIARESLPR